MSKYASIVWDGETLTVPPEMGCPQPHHLLSTPNDNLIELCGRICYDSTRIVKSRSSPDYHKHIAEVGHLSVQEHANFTALLPRWFYQPEPTKEMALLKSMLNRPGLFLREVADGYRITFNVRTVNDWEKHNKCFNSETSRWLGNQLKSIAADLCPMALFDFVKYETLTIQRVAPETEEEIWISFHIREVSRSLTHELVRHGDFTGISMRSSRYVDEHESDWSWHPVINQWAAKGGDISGFKSCENMCKEVYGTAVSGLENFLKSEGVDKFSARKQARGAARGVLGNALSTELIFSASLAQWKWILLLRVSDPAEAEIRVALTDVFVQLKDRFPKNFENWNLVPAADGIGQVIHQEIRNVGDQQRDLPGSECS